MDYSKDQNKFYRDAILQISDDPLTRLSPVTRAVIDRKDFIFDAHCHVFDGECINVGYLMTRFLGLDLPDFAKKIIWKVFTNSEMSLKAKMDEVDFTEEVYEVPGIFDMPVDENYLRSLQKRVVEEQFHLDMSKEKSLGNFQLKGSLKSLRMIIDLLLSGKMSKVYEKFRDQYAVTNVDEEKELLTVVLGMDLNKGWDGKIKKPIDSQVIELGKLSNTYPVLPFLPLDPRRAEDSGAENLYEMFLNAFNKDKKDGKYFGVKFYPALGYLPSDSRLDMIFKICAEKKIPVVSHCGGEMVSTFHKSIKVNREGKEEYVQGGTRIQRAAFLNEPNEWIPVLEKAKGLHLNLGHFGSAKAWAEPTHEKAKRKETIFKMMKAHQVYADFSFNLKKEKASREFAKALFAGDENSGLMLDRSMFGTDFWVVLPFTDLIKDQQFFLKEVGEHAEKLLVTNVMKFLYLDK